MFFILSLIFQSCADDNEIEEPTFSSKDAILIEIGDLTIENGTNIEFSIPNNGNLFFEEKPLFYLFYKVSEEANKSWGAIPSLNLEENYKIYYSRMNNSSEVNNHILKLSIEEINSSEKYIKPIQINHFEIIAVKPSSLIGINLQGLNLFDYDEMVKYYGLE